MEKGSGGSLFPRQSQAPDRTRKTAGLKPLNWYYSHRFGKMPEWSNGTDSKSVVSAMAPRVQIPIFPPYSKPKPLKLIEFRGLLLSAPCKVSKKCRKRLETSVSFGSAATFWRRASGREPSCITLSLIDKTVALAGDQLPSTGDRAPSTLVGKVGQKGCRNAE